MTHEHTKAKSNEQLSWETNKLYRRLEDDHKNLVDLSLKITKMEGQLDSLIVLMQDALAHLPAAQEHKIRYEELCKSVNKIESQYVSRHEFDHFYTSFKNLQKWLIAIAAAFLVPTAAIAVSIIFGEPGVIDGLE